ncbi:MAG: hypothetical protein GY708_05255 [Actinomycetia bacterium]|nr:hypothetical protein [Actinomycetes bacterium]
MTAIVILLNLLPLIVIGGVVWAIVSLRRGDDGPDNVAITVRRVVVYILMLVTMILAASGLAGLAVELIDRDPDGNESLATALALSIVSVPGFAAVLKFADARLRTRDERRSLAWSMYLNTALLVTLIAASVMTVQALASLFEPADATEVVAQTLAAGVWIATWALHWFWLRPRHGIAGDVHLAAGSVVGLLTLGIGGAESLYHLFDSFYTTLFDDPIVHRGGPSGEDAIATLIVGATVWGWHWVLRYRTAERTNLWHVTVVPLGSLIGFVSAATTAALIINRVTVWYLGNPNQTQAERHFDHLPAETAVMVVGLVAWTYHRLVLGREAERNTPRRVYEYLIAGAGLVTAVVGASIVLSALMADSSVDRTNTTIAGTVTLVLGGLTWLWHWKLIGAAEHSDTPGERASTVRKTYLIILFGASVAAAIIAFIGLLTTSLEDVLDGNLSRTTLHDARVPIAVLMSVSGVAWYHLRLYAREHRSAASAEGGDLSPAILETDADLARLTTTPEPTPVRVAVAAPAGVDLGPAYRLVPGAVWHVWTRTDTLPGAQLDTEEFASEVADLPGSDLVVIVDSDGGVDVIPVEATG